MRSFSLARGLVQKLTYRPDHPLRDIHPITALMDCFAFILFGLMYLQLEAPSVGQQLYFSALLLLYAVSSLYHGYRWHWFTRFLDQSCIGLYIIACPLPFLPQTWWTWSYALTLALLCLAIKWCDWEKEQYIGSLVFLGFGLVSVSMLYVVGLPSTGFSRLGYEAMVSAVALALFCFMLWIFQSNRGEFFPGVWGCSETCHSVLFIAMFMMSSLVVSVPVL